MESSKYSDVCNMSVVIFERNHRDLCNTNYIPLHTFSQFSLVTLYIRDIQSTSNLAVYLHIYPQLESSNKVLVELTRQTTNKVLTK